jgi:signal transduction histidine kinase
MVHNEAKIHRMKTWLNNLNLVQRYSLAALLVMLLVMVILAWWVGREIEANVIHRVSADSALFVENFVVVPLQELATQRFVSPSNLKTIEELLQTSPLGNEIVAFKIWAPGGLVIFGDRQGETLPITDDQEHAWQGKVWAEVSNLDDAENANLKEQFSRLLEMYIPIRLEGSERVIAVVEFYQTINALEQMIATAQRQSWLVVGLIMLAAYGLLVGIVRQGHTTIVRQQRELEDKVMTLNQLLEQNEELNERVRRAASRTAALNERFLRRISAELHDGPAQDLSFSLLHLDNVATSLEQDLSPKNRSHYGQSLETIQQSLTRATQEIRHIASGLRLPELGSLSLTDTLERVIRDHERRTQSHVETKLDHLPKQVPLPLKVTLFRLLQEALSNAYRHGEGRAQKVKVQLMTNSPSKLHLEISDEGPGFMLKETSQEGHLGLVGMRERVESLGGTFRVESAFGQGTKVIAELPLSESFYG